MQIFKFYPKYIYKVVIAENKKQADQSHTK